jgi:hypothetical protein
MLGKIVINYASRSKNGDKKFEHNKEALIDKYELSILKKPK